MKKFIDKKQKIVATCLLQKDGKVFLLRKSQLRGGESILPGIGYFDVPKFEIDFGDSPELMIKKYFTDYFDHDVTSVEVIDVQQKVIDEHSVQIFEIIYKIQCCKIYTEYERQGVFFFADQADLLTYMLSGQYEYIAPYLEELYQKPTG